MMKNSVTLIAGIVALTGLSGLFEAEAIDAVTERRALRKASGVYGAPKNPPIPDGRFRGKVGNQYNEHALVNLKLRKGRRKSKAKLIVWDGVNHKTRFVRINAKVKSGGRLVVLSGGSVRGKGLLPLGIEIRRGSFPGKVKTTPGKPSLVANCRLAGVDLTNGNARVSGRATFRGDQ